MDNGDLIDLKVMPWLATNVNNYISLQRRSLEKLCSSREAIPFKPKAPLFSAKTYIMIQSFNKVFWMKGCIFVSHHKIRVQDLHSSKVN